MRKAEEKYESKHIQITNESYIYYNETTRYKEMGGEGDIYGVVKLKKGDIAEVIGIKKGYLLVKTGEDDTLSYTLVDVQGVVPYLYPNEIKYLLHLQDRGRVYTYGDENKMKEAIRELLSQGVISINEKMQSFEVTNGANIKINLNIEGA